MQLFSCHQKICIIVGVALFMLSCTSKDHMTLYNIILLYHSTVPYAWRIKFLVVTCILPALSRCVKGDQQRFGHNIVNVVLSAIYYYYVEGKCDGI